MSEATDSVKPVIAGLRELATKNAKSQHGPKFDSWADHIAALVKRTKELERLTTALPQTLGDLSDLPDELRDELSIAEGDELDSQVVTVVNATGGTANIDQILVGLFRKFKVVQRRRFLQQRLYRMIRNDMLWSVPDRKGLYTTTPVEGGKQVPDEFEEASPSTTPAKRRRAEQDFKHDDDWTRGPSFDDEIPF